MGSISSAEDLLDVLETYFCRQPHSLGARPSIGDFGMIAPLYAHLGRDPAPSALMRSRARASHRWVERMNGADAGLAQLPDVVDEFLSDDQIPAPTQTMGTRAEIGTHFVRLQGVEIELVVQHYSIWILPRVQDHYAGLEAAERDCADALLVATGLRRLVEGQSRRRIAHAGFVEVLG